MDRWDKYFLDLAQVSAGMSKDPSTKVGAVIARNDKTIVSLGFNGFPRFTCDDAELYEDRDEKLRRIVHAEMNAILSAREPLHGCSMWTTLGPCARCAAAIIQSGIRSVTCAGPKTLPARWVADWYASISMFHDAGITLKHIGES